jgi:uncharacterized protein YdeI (YjbR/CyaY-like superfamily)
MSDPPRFSAVLREGGGGRAAFDLAEGLAADPVAAGTYDRLSFTHRRDYVRWITEAKRPETRARRVAGALDRLREGKPRR